MFVPGAQKPQSQGLSGGLHSFTWTKSCRDSRVPVWKAKGAITSMLGFLFGVGLTLYFINRYRRGGFRSGGRRMRRRRREWILNRLSAHLETTPSQDRVLEDVVDDLMGVVTEERGAFLSARGTLADALGAETFDSGPLDELREQQDASLNRVHDAAREALEKVHAVLNYEQRTRLAAFMSGGDHDHRRRRWRRRSHLYAA